MREVKKARRNPYTPRTVGIEPVERLAKVFYLPTPETAPEPGSQDVDWLAAELNAVLNETDTDSLLGLGFVPSPDSRCASLACSDCAPPQQHQEVIDNELLTGVSEALHSLDIGQLRRAHELAQFISTQTMERESDLFAIRLEINAAFDAGATETDVLELDDRDLVHVAINRVIDELGYDD